MLLSLLLMFMDHRQHHLESIRSALSVVVYPLQLAVNLPTAIGHWVSTNMALRTSLIEENQLLKDQLFKQEIRLQKFAALESENHRLRELLQSSNPGWERVQIAELISVDFDPFRRQVLLNKGSNDGVFEGHPLLDAHGIMGQVVRVTPVNSTAMLLTDPNHAIPVQVNRNGLRAIALGTGAPDELEIPHIPNNADIQVGDLLISSGLGMRFPYGYPVAEVSKVERDPSEPYAKIVARPTGYLERAREVLLVWPQSGEEHAAAAPDAGVTATSAPITNEAELSATPAHPAAATAAKPAATAAQSSAPVPPKPAAAQPSAPATPKPATAAAQPSAPATSKPAAAVAQPSAPVAPKPAAAAAQPPAAAIPAAQPSAPVAPKPATATAPAAPKPPAAGATP